jgi:hypothetical protein
MLSAMLCAGSQKEHKCLLTLKDNGQLWLHLGAEPLLQVRLPALLPLENVQLQYFPPAPRGDPALLAKENVVPGEAVEEKVRRGELFGLCVDDLWPVDLSHACGRTFLLHFAGGVNVQLQLDVHGHVELVSKCMQALKAVMEPPDCRKLLQEYYLCAAPPVSEFFACSTSHSEQSCRTEKCAHLKAIVHRCQSAIRLAYFWPSECHSSACDHASRAAWSQQLSQYQLHTCHHYLSSVILRTRRICSNGVQAGCEEADWKAFHEFMMQFWSSTIAEATDNATNEPRVPPPQNVAMDVSEPADAWSQVLQLDETQQLLSTRLYPAFAHLASEPPDFGRIDQAQVQQARIQGALRNLMVGVLEALHSIFEDLKLDQVLWRHIPYLASLLLCLAKAVSLDSWQVSFGTLANATLCMTFTSQVCAYEWRTSAPAWFSGYLVDVQSVRIIAC